MSRKKFSENLNKLKQVVLEYEELRPLDHERYGTEHMLIALFEITNSTASKLLAAEGFTVDSAKSELDRLKGKVNPNKPAPPSHSWGPTPSDVLRLANSLADRYESNCVDLEHVLLALVQKNKTGAYELLSKLGINQQRVENQLVQKLQENATKHA